LPSAGKAQDIVRHHRLIVKAIADGKPDEAKKHVRTHLSGTLSELARIRARIRNISATDTHPKPAYKPNASARYRAQHANRARASYLPVTPTPGTGCTATPFQ
jgi:hypothetical protein